LPIYVLPKEVCIKSFVATKKDYEKKIYKIPDSKFISNEHNLIKKEQEEQPNLLSVYGEGDSSSIFELEGHVHQSIDHYLVFKMNPESYQEMINS
jgi:hypothetical protein